MPFPAKGGRKPTKKKRPAPVDDFDDEDDDFDEPTPRRKSKGGAKKAASKKGGKGKKSAGSGQKSKAPLFIGVGVLAVALAGGVGFMLMQANNDTGGSETTATGGGESTDAVNGGGSPASGGDGGSGHDSGGGHDSAEAAMMAGDTTGPNGGSSSTAKAPMTSNAAVGGTVATPGSISLQWLPQQSEALVYIDVDRLLSGPLNQLLSFPPVSGGIQQFRDKAGFGPEDIKSITIGVAEVSQLAASDQSGPPKPPPTIGVIRSKRPIDPAKIQAAIPQAQSIKDAGLNYIQLPGDLPKALWFADATTAIVGEVPLVRQAAGGTTPPITVDTTLLDGQSVVQAVFSPQDAAIFQHPNFQGPPGSSEGSRALVAAIRDHVTAIGIGFDLTNDLGGSFVTRCRDAAGTQAVAAAIKKANADNLAQMDALAGSPQAQLLGPMIETYRNLINSTQISMTDTICRSTSIAPGGGQQLVTQIPVAIGAMFAQGFAQGQTIGREIRAEDNLKQIALAMQNFHDGYGRFPNAAARSPTGEKWLSWRVHLLPFLGQQTLYEQFNLEEPWDSPTNRPLAARMPEVFNSPNAAGLEPGMTVIQVPVSAGTAFEDSKGFGMKAFTDGTSNTVLILEAAPGREVYWTQPEDFQFDPAKPLAGIGGFGPDGFHAAFADGSVRFIESATDTEILKAIFSKSGGEEVNGF